MANRYDVCVVGGGLAGSTTAAHAAELGQRVVLLEQGADDKYMCNSRMTAGVFHLAIRSVRDNPAELEQSVQRLTRGAHPKMAHALAHNVERSVRWLQKIGVRFIKATQDAHHDFVVAPPATHRNGPFDVFGRGGDVMLGTLHKALRGAGGEIRLGWEADQLIVENGVVQGVIAKTPDGGREEIRASNVVIADGGFQANLDMIKEAGIAVDPTNVVQRNARTGRGSGLKMALAAGAKASASLLGFYGHLLSVKALKDDSLWPYPWLDLVTTAGVAVGKNGRRYVDESRGGVFVANKTAANPPSGIGYSIFDQKIWEEEGTTYLNPPNPRLAQYEGAMFKANTIGELAGLLDIPAEALREEVDAYNAAIANNSLGALSPPRNGGAVKAKPILQAPFYGVPMVPGITYTMGGIMTDENCRALKESGEPFPGLFAAGCAAGGIEGGADVDYIGGLTKSVTMGVLAAEFIANNAKASAA